MSTCEVRLFVLKGCFTAYVSGMTVVDEIFCPPVDKKNWDKNDTTLNPNLYRLIQAC
jgi:hypothetical protein